MSGQDALLPCPFCGGTSQMVLGRTCDPGTPYNPAHRAQPIVRCGDCYAEVPGVVWTGENTAVAAWNRRATLTRTPSPSEGVREALIEAQAFIRDVRECDRREYTLERIAAALASSTVEITLGGEETTSGETS